MGFSRPEGVIIKEIDLQIWLETEPLRPNESWLWLLFP
jgi:hypothetical protein